MKFMERRGSGLRKIVSETAKLPGYTERMRPEFHSIAIAFRVVLRNVNYSMDGSDSDTVQDTMHDGKLTMLLNYCTEAKSRDEMMGYFSLASREHFRKAYLKLLRASGKLKRHSGNSRKAVPVLLRLDWTKR